jgi:hypothetical protein
MSADNSIYAEWLLKDGERVTLVLDSGENRGLFSNGFNRKVQLDIYLQLVSSSDRNLEFSVDREFRSMLCGKFKRSDISIKKILSYLEKKGFIERISKGSYRLNEIYIER